jgi:pimeloyl-ACP methyl ester carboxylesterase
MTTDGPVSPETTHPQNSYVTHRAQAPGGDLHVIDQPGDGPAIVLLHGFPDDWRIYQKLTGHLAPRRAVAFDFLGCGHSARPQHPDPGQHEAELTAVLDTLGIKQAVLVGHDDGAADLIAAVEQIHPKALRQRCLVHRARNVLAKVPAGMQAEVKDAYWALFDTEDLDTPPGLKLAEIIGTRITAMAARYQATYSAAMKCLLTDREGLTAYLRCPAEHHKRIRHSNFRSAPSARPAASRSSAGCPARPAASPCSGQC